MRILLSPLLLIVSIGCAFGYSDDEIVTRGFRDMYNLSFADAHSAFESWQKLHPEDPRGPVFDAAAYLFSEFDRLRILQSEFFVKNDSFFDRQRPVADPNVKRQFEAELARSKQLSDAILRHSPDDQNALLATVTRYGLHADYLALIDKQNMAALAEIKLGREAAQKLLAAHPDAYDAHLAAGVENYLLSQKAAPVRWLLRFGGAQTDRSAGIAELRIVAAKGRYFAPYAQLLLAVAALREGNKSEARRLLAALSERFPKNALYREELKKING